jgi:hypothetical protein
VAALTQPEIEKLIAFLELLRPSNDTSGSLGYPLFDEEAFDNMWDLMSTFADSCPCVQEIAIRLTHAHSIMAKGRVVPPFAEGQFIHPDKRVLIDVPLHAFFKCDAIKRLFKAEYFHRLTIGRIALQDSKTAARTTKLVSLAQKAMGKGRFAVNYRAFKLDGPADVDPVTGGYVAWSKTYDSTAQNHDTAFLADAANTQQPDGMTMLLLPTGRVSFSSQLVKPKDASIGAHTAEENRKQGIEDKDMYAHIDQNKHFSESMLCPAGKCHKVLEHNGEYLIAAAAMSFHHLGGGEHVLVSGSGVTNRRYTRWSTHKPLAAGALNWGGFPADLIGATIFHATNDSLKRKHVLVLSYADMHHMGGLGALITALFIHAYGYTPLSPSYTPPMTAAQTALTTAAAAAPLRKLPRPQYKAAHFTWISLAARRVVTRDAPVYAAHWVQYIMESYDDVDAKKAGKLIAKYLNQRTVGPAAKQFQWGSYIRASDDGGGGSGDGASAAGPIGGGGVSGDGASAAGPIGGGGVSGDGASVAGPIGGGGVSGDGASAAGPIAGHLVPVRR